jgi:two-component system response regulator
MTAKRPILLIEDNVSDVALARRAFEKAGIIWPLVVAESGHAAVSYLERIIGEVDVNKLMLPALVLLDLKLPELDGIEVLKRIRNNAVTSQIPVVILSTSQEYTDVQNSYANGANSYIRKPVDFLAFTAIVKQIADYWLRVNILPQQ